MDFLFKRCKKVGTRKTTPQNATLVGGLRTGTKFNVNQVPYGRTRIKNPFIKHEADSSQRILLLQLFFVEFIDDRGGSVSDRKGCWR